MLGISAGDWSVIIPFKKASNTQNFFISFHKIGEITKKLKSVKTFKALTASSHYILLEGKKKKDL